MMKKNLIYIYTLCIVILFWLLPAAGFAQDFVYRPINPAFGGSPINYSWLLNSASAQNLYQDDQDFGFGDDPLMEFQRSLQRRIIRELTESIIEKRFGKIDLSKGGSFAFGNFTIEVVPGPSGINIIIQNLATGEQTTITIPNL